MTVQICSMRDSECGYHPANWCKECPRKVPMHPVDALDMLAWNVYGWKVDRDKLAKLRSICDAPADSQ